MKRDRIFMLTVLACLLSQAHASGLETPSSDSPSPDAAPMEEKAVDSGQPRVRSGERGAELDLSVPNDYDQVDQAEVMTPAGEDFPLSRQEQIVHDYETDNVGIKIPAKNNDSLGFRLQLIDYDQWPPDRQK